MLNLATFSSSVPDTLFVFNLPHFMPFVIWKKFVDVEDINT